MIITTDVSATIEAQIAAAGANETGGLLLGWTRSDLQTIVVVVATGPGKRARATPASLQLDVHDLQTEVDRLWSASAGHVTYLGDWHLHHQDIPTPSSRDHASIREIASDPAIGVTDPVMLIIGRNRWCAWIGPEVLPVEVTRLTR